MPSFFAPGEVTPINREAHSYSSREPGSQTSLRQHRSLTAALSGLLLLIALACASAAPGDENWDGRFGVPGAGEIRSIVVQGQDLYAGGPFGASASGGGRANYIARWNGSGGWSPLGTSLTGAVNVVTIFGSHLYAGGVFAMAGNSSANAVAR